MTCTNRVTNCFIHRLGETAEFTDVEIDPTHIVFFRLLRNQNDFRFDDPRIANHSPTGLNDCLRHMIAEMFYEAAIDRIAITLNARDRLQITRGETTTEIDHREIHAALGAFLENSRG